MKKIIITSGNKYIDIDAYAGCIAYSKLLNAIGYNAVAVTNATSNKSISKIIRNLGFSFKDYIPKRDDQFIILDVSNPKMFDKCVIIDNIVEIIDHHSGFESYWQTKNIKSEIEPIGSICTIIFEKYIENNKVELLDLNLCKLLISGILDNTLNLKASITTKRDAEAYKRLLELGKVNIDWAKEYFFSCQKGIEKNLQEAIINDIKIEYINDMLPEVIGQLLIFNASSIIQKQELITNIFSKYDKEWFINIISLEDGKSYIYTTNIAAQEKLEKIFNTCFKNNILVLKKFMLRKEIMNKARII